MPHFPHFPPATATATATAINMYLKNSNSYYGLRITNSQHVCHSKFQHFLYLFFSCLFSFSLFSISLYTANFNCIVLLLLLLSILWMCVCERRGIVLYLISVSFRKFCNAPHVATGLWHTSLLRPPAEG